MVVESGEEHLKAIAAEFTPIKDAGFGVCGVIDPRGGCPFEVCAVETTVSLRNLKPSLRE